MEKICSINDLARLLGLSKTTVSFVLSGQGNARGISKDTQQRIIDTARKHSFSPSQLARSLSTGRTNTIGFVAPDLSDPFYSSIFKRVCDLFYLNGYVVIGVSSDEQEHKERHLIDTLLKRGVDGLLIASSQPPASDWLSDLKSSCPIVLFDRDNGNSSFPSVTVDNEGGTHRLVSRLIADGHRNIGMIYVNPWISTIMHRINGFRKAMRESGLACSAMLETHVDINNLRNDMQLALHRFCDGNNAATAVVLLNNVLGTEAIYCINRLWKHPVKPVLACFDDIDMFDYSLPPVMSVKQPVDIIAEVSVRLLLQSISRDRGGSDGVPESVVLDTTLKIRSN